MQGHRACPNLSPNRHGVRKPSRAVPDTLRHRAVDCAVTKVCPTCAAQHEDSLIFCPLDGAVLRTDPSDASLIGTILADRYLITALLGEGGMGVVYRAQHVKLPREAAIKVMHGALTQDPDALARFQREAAAAAAASKVEHDAIARVFDFGETPQGLVYLAMEYLDGPTLKQLLAQQGPLPLPRVAALVHQIAAGLEAAHRQGIVHRDLKADNVLVVPTRGGGEQAKIVDFGIAKAIGAGERALTRTGFVVGTPEYMRPEQLLGDTVDHRSDVYALALLAYHLLTGEMPFDTRTPDRGLMARLTSDPRPLETVRPDARWSLRRYRPPPLRPYRGPPHRRPPHRSVRWSRLGAVDDGGACRTCRSCAGP